jgi:hypothetical protein
MDDDKVRELLGRYRPVSPPAHLRTAVLSRPAGGSRMWPWAAAAAALVVATLTLHVAANRAIARVSMPASTESIEALAATLGGDEEAHRAARLIVAERRFRSWLTGGDTRSRIESDLYGVN